MAQNEHKKVLQELSEAYTQINEARFWGDKEGVARHNKELRDSGARSFDHPGGHGTTGHFTDEQVEKLKQKGYEEREIKDIEDAETWDGPGMQHDEPLEPSAEGAPSVGDIFDGIDYDEMIIAIEDDGTIYTRELAEGGNRYSADQFTYEIKDRIAI